MKHREARWLKTTVSVHVSVLGIMLLSACGSSKPPRSQVVASVNDREITISQLNQALQILDPPAVTTAVAKSTIDSLIDEELLVEGALKEKLDRDPAIMQAMEEAKRQVLARAYAEQRVWPKTPVSLAEQEKYYKANPALFENRKIYELTIYTVPAVVMNDVLREDLDKAHSADSVREVLEKHDVKFETQQMDAPAENVPLVDLPIMSRASVGDVLIAPEKDGKIRLTSIDRIEAKPLSFERARPAIGQYLTTAAQQEALNAYLKREKATAKITYAAEFANNQASNAAAMSSQRMN